MNTYSVAQVEAITGINAHTLRIWERRYNFINPMRTATNIRYYSDAELRKLLSISVLQRNGYKISKIDKLDNEQITSAVEEILELSTTTNQDEINSLIISMLNFDENQFNKIFQRKLIQKGLLGTIIDVIYPFLYNIGILWGANKVIPAQEHFISNLIRQKVLSSIDLLPIPPNHAPGLLLFLLEDERHEIGLLLTSFIARSIGWRVIYLGQDVPTDNINDVTGLVKIDYLMTMLISTRTDNINILLQKLIDDTQLPIVISGNNNFINQISNNKNIIKLYNPNELISFLEGKIKN
jgi:DNA-binding transcriptional MerR regulator